MSQHLFHTKHKDKPVIVQIGYNRPLSYFHMVVYELGKEDDPVYTNLDEVDTFDLSLDDYRAALNEMGIAVPESMFEQAAKDALQPNGNRYVTHQADGTFVESQA